jgi:hypothetical protein
MNSEPVSQNPDIFRGDHAIGDGGPLKCHHPSFEDDMWVSSFDENGDFLEVSFEASPDYQTVKNTNKQFFHVLAGKKRRQEQPDASAKPKRKEFTKRLSQIASRVSTSIRANTHSNTSFSSKFQKKQKRVRNLSKKVLQKLEKERKRRKRQPIPSTTDSTTQGLTSSESKAVRSLSPTSPISVDAGKTQEPGSRQSSNTFDTEHSGKSDVGESANATMLYRDQQVSPTWGRHQNHGEDQPDLSASEQPRTHITTGPLSLESVDAGRTQEPRSRQSSNTFDTEHSEKSDAGESANATILYRDQQVSSNWGHYQKYTSMSSEQGHQEDQLDLSASPEQKIGIEAGPLSLILDEIENAENETRERINKLEHTFNDEEKSQDLVLVASPIHENEPGPINKLGQETYEDDTTNSKKKHLDYRARRKSTRDAGPFRETMSAVQDATKREDALVIHGWKATQDARWVVFALLLLLVSTIIPYYWL